MLRTRKIWTNKEFASESRNVTQNRNERRKKNNRKKRSEMQFKLRPLTGYTTVNEQHTTTVMVFWLSMYVMGFFVFNVVRSLSASLMTLIVSLYDAFLVSKTASQFWSQFGITIMNCSTIFKGNLMMCQRKMWESFKNKQQQQSFYFFLQNVFESKWQIVCMECYVQMPECMKVEKIQRKSFCHETFGLF